MTVLSKKLYCEVFTARCHDTGEESNAENARLFKEEVLKRNAKNSSFLKLNSLRLGVNSIIALSTAVQNKPIDRINIADNSISDFGMHAIKTVLTNLNLTYLNLASNMISGDGLE